MPNSVDPDETPRSAASHLGLHCLLCSTLFYTGRQGGTHTGISGLSHLIYLFIYLFIQIRGIDVGDSCTSMNIASKFYFPVYKLNVCLYSYFFRLSCLLFRHFFTNKPIVLRCCRFLAWLNNLYDFLSGFLQTEPFLKEVYSSRNVFAPCGRESFLFGCTSIQKRDHMYSPKYMYYL